MGSAQIEAAGMFLNGTGGSLVFESFTTQGFVETSNASGDITDSAAAASAMATGVKVNNGVISQRIPGNGTNLETILELAKSLGLSTGLITTTNISHATPAAFASHTSSRNLYTEIINDYISLTLPDVLMGGAQFVDPVSANAVGYIVVEDKMQLEDLNTESLGMVWGQFGESHLPYESDKIDIFPSLSQSVTTALDILDNNPNGFFLMIEGGRIDHAGHENNIIRNISETIEFANAVEKVTTWSNGKKNTLIIVTADHETGGLEILNNNGKGNYPTVRWNTTGHTLTDVPIFARGINAHLLAGNISNTAIYDVMRLTISE
jgi:alkaline phosphatase